MDTHLLALQLMAAQGCLGAFDTLYHHELREALPQRDTARRELGIHAARALIYSGLFIGLSEWAWHGVWAWVLLALFVVEIVLTLWDFVVEDKTRLLPASERVTHTILAINGGAFIMLLVLNLPAWLAQPAALHLQTHGWLSVFLLLCGIGVGISGLRDALAVRDIGRHQAAEEELPAVHFGHVPERVLVSGATGFIGQQLVQALLRDGHEVTVLTRAPRRAAWLFDGKVVCVADMAELPAERRIDVIVNLAGERILGWRWTAARRQKLRDSRIALTQSIVAWIARAQIKPRLMLSASAIGYYGIQQRGDVSQLAEDEGAQKIFMSDLCREWEAAAQQASDYGMQVMCMRLGLVFGRQGALPLMLLPIRLGLGGPMGTGSQWMSWIHVRDVLGAIAHLWNLSREGGAEKPLNRVFNFTAPEQVSQRQFSKIAARVLKRPCFMPTPGWPVRLLLGEQADLLLEGQRVVPRQLQASGFVFYYPDVKSALSCLV
ncbi:MAG: TIGR01777 family protein [Burkholderiales bacterium]|nr:TIGR01777 family protein [Burkholderiales bacterium]